MASTEGDRAQLIAQAWELATVHRWSSRQIAAELRISQSAAAKYVREGKAAEGHIHLLDRAERREMSVAALDYWMAEIVTAYQQSRLTLKDAAPLYLAVDKQVADRLGLNAPSRVQVESVEPEPDPGVMEAVREAQRIAHAEQQAIEAREAAKNNGDGDDHAA